MRDYKNIPDPKLDVKKFNLYLVNNNEVVFFSAKWIIIKNSYIEGQLVCFCLDNVAYYGDLDEVALYGLKRILQEYKDNHVYINATKDKSVPNRFHLHIKL